MREKKLQLQVNTSHCHHSCSPNTQNNAKITRRPLVSCTINT